MFDQFKQMGQLAALLKDRDKLEAAARRVKDELERTRVEGSAGGGAARAVATGTLAVESVRIEPALAAGLAADEAHREQAERLIAEAVNDALAKARERAQELVTEEARELGLEQYVPQLRKLLP